MREVKAHPLIMAIPRLSEGASVPPSPELPHAVIDPSALRAAKASAVE
jgi:hypothetical protein